MENRTFVFHAEEPQGAPGHFWAAAGSDQIYPEILDENGAFLLNRSDRYGTLRYLRNHHVLSELYDRDGRQIGGDVYREDEDGKPIYDFTYINAVYAECLRHGIKPVVEMDFIPRALARPRTEPLPGSRELYERASYPADWDKWRALLVRFTENLVETFGLEEVRTWYFEAWNEPDLCALVPFLQQWPAQDWEQFMRLYDVFVDAVTSVDEQLKVGGPGGCTQAFMYRFFEHVCRGTNYVTGRRGTRIDFISYHFYGMVGFAMPEFPMENTRVAGYVSELHAIDSLMKQFPELDGVEFHLNEWGECAQGGLSKQDHPAFDILRNGEFSALYLVKLIGSLLALRRTLGLNLTMLLYWGFAGEDESRRAFWGTRSLSTWPHVCKPLQTVQEMLAGLGETPVRTEGAVGARVGAYAYRDGTGLQAVAYHFDETRLDERYEPAPVTLRATGLAPGTYRLTVTALGREQNNTFAVYRAMGSPAEPDEAQVRALQQANEWKPLCEQTVRIDGDFVWEDTLQDNEVRFYFFKKLEDAAEGV